MSLYSDLNEVLTPYAQKIKRLAAADEEIKADLDDVRENFTTKIINDITDEYSALNIESGYWDTVSGLKRNSSEWVRSNFLIPFVTNTDTVVFSTCGYPVVIVCFDKNYEKMSQYAVAPVLGRASIPKPIPAGTCYIGLSVHDSAPTKISIAKLKAMDSLEYPYADSYLIENYWMKQNGKFSSADTYSCIMIPVIPGERYYTNAILMTNFMCFDVTSTLLGEAEYEGITKNGRIYTIPENAVFAYCNIPHNKTHGTYSTVVYKVTKNKSILCIGDSITYLDGETNTDYDSASLFLGYQKVIQKAGYETVSAGYSGYTYATNVKDGSKAIGSIYTKIVTEQYDVSGYDYILLTAGTNDDLYNVTIGDVPTDYQNHNYNTDTTAGALAAIIKYIRDNNPTAKIILCTILKSRAINRAFAESSLYAEMIRQMANFASCYLCDNYQNYNVQPYSTGWNLFFYDGTHPNKVGMERLGKLMLDAIEAS